ncbi:hypothetical protein BLA6993_05504 [Burkholderia lata]|uniref:hypothetical protein n=1 Tax=Burkholderia lata (strain ATCC 17760 / DSM 23089 / LMG 22485 / NCIMB 9086 / R18194 / 383) TaxID=482957 RepID=UPI0014535346|nr:hypothetical protein [Burkholderia lata]VWC14232.1 hypothetical protein BLA6993_05504 [Burkholderia lata]
MTEIEIFEASANVILGLCREEGDLLVRLERIAYAASVVKQRADAQIEKFQTAAESNHG